MYYIELDKSISNLKVNTYKNKKELEEDLEYFGVNKAEELSCYDYKVFSCRVDADVYLKKFNKVLNALDNNVICKAKGIPALLYKRRYIVQTLLNEKLQTFRHFKINAIAGDLINLYDQTYFLTVRLTKVIKHNSKSFEYQFELIETK